MRLIVARHCQTDWNAAGRIQGQTNIQLNRTGWEQARKLARGVRNLGVELLYTSDLDRAIETGSCVTDVTGVLGTADPRLRECCFGSLEGLPYAQFVLNYGPSHSFGHHAINADFRRFGGEAGFQLVMRQLEALNEIKRAHGDKTAMIIGHGRSLRALLTQLGHPTKFLRDQGSFIDIEY